MRDVQHSRDHLLVVLTPWHIPERLRLADERRVLCFAGHLRVCSHIQFWAMEVVEQDSNFEVC